MIDHDHLFKAVLRNFFVEFIELFLPELSNYMDVETAEPQPVDKELFGRERKGRSLQVDVLMKVRNKDDSSSFLVHVEVQAKPQTKFGLRLLKYYVLLQDDYQLPVYPIALFSFARSKKEQVGSLLKGFPDREILRFQYAVIQLNLLDWRSYADKSNPVAAAFMAKMKMAQKEKPHVKLKCVTMLLGLKLEPQKEWIISEFIDTYLRLSKEEEREYESELRALGPERREEVMQVRMSWKEQGRAEGKAEGKAEGESKAALAIAKRILNRRLGQLEAATLTALECLAVAKLEELSEAAIDFSTATDLSTWLAANQ